MKIIFANSSTVSNPFILEKKPNQTIIKQGMYYMTVQNEHQYLISILFFFQPFSFSFILLITCTIDETIDL